MNQLSGIRLRNLLFEQGIASDVIFVPDSLYVCPSWDWLLHEFKAELMRFVGEYLQNYDSECTDCDDFALAAKFCAQWLHRRTKDRLAHSALAVGEFTYLKRSDMNHAILSAFVGDHPSSPGQIQLVFLEPQPRAYGPVTLSPEKIQTCSSARF